MTGQFAHGHFELSDEQVSEIRQMRPEAVVESERAVLVHETSEVGPDTLHWSAESPRALALSVTTMQQQVPLAEASAWKITLINELVFANALLAIGFRVVGHYLDHWLNDLAGYKPSRVCATVIREAVHFDAEKLAALSATCAHDPGWMASSAAWYQDWMADPNSVVFVVERKGLLCGLCSARQYGRDKDKLWVRELAVHPSFRRMGIGRALLDACLRWGQAQHSERAFLAADSRSVEALSLYTRIGFEPNGEQEHNLELSA